MALNIVSKWFRAKNAPRLGDFMRACRRARRASVPTGLRARGRGACGARRGLHQHHGRRINSVAAANWLRPSGTATRHAGGGRWWASGNREAGNALDMRLAGRKWLGGRMVAWF